jgi:crossover junction endodeoxyribonuclease RuvC
MIILGIDPGLATTGYGVIRKSKVSSKKSQKLKLVDYGCIITEAKFSSGERLEKIYRELKKIIKKYKPSKIAIEELFFAKNIKTAMKVGEARGVVLLTARETKTAVFEFSPLRVKLALTGYGRASKRQIQEMVKTLLSLEKIPKPDDAADALAVALCCSQIMG